MKRAATLSLLARDLSKGLLWICFLAASIRFSQAQISPASFSFAGSTLPLYDVSGDYQFSQTAVGSDGSRRDLKLPITLQEDVTGRVLGSGVTNVLIDNVSYAASYSAVGRISGGGRATRLGLVVSWQGQGANSFRVLVQYQLKVNPNGLLGSGQGSLKSAQIGSGRIRSAIAGLPLPAGMDGSWTLEMDSAGSTSWAGTGTITLPNGRTIPGTLMGTTAAHTGLNRVQLQGVGDARGNALQVAYFSGIPSPQTVSGRVLGQTVLQILNATPYASPQACSECHGPVNKTLGSTPHAMEGVGCQNCHGPLGNHAANPYDPVARPQIDMSGTACGTCHSGPQHPTYEEWSASAHSTMVIQLKPSNADKCGRCHSGSVRESLLDGTPLPQNPNVPIGCPVCHEPHELTGNPAQLRNPVASTNEYVMTTSASFASQYNPNINICGQCHNDRGAAWTLNDSAPHKSPQYNFLLGTVGEIDTNDLPHFLPASHALLITNQCAGCHMPMSPYQSPAAPAITGHKMEVVNFNNCLKCHPLPEMLADFVMNTVSNRVQTIKGELDAWALSTNAPPALSAKYGVLAWEYSSPGDLSSGSTGPDSTEQLQIPENIRRARFNLYIVFHDGSYGVHNGPYAISLLDAAESWVQAQLSP